MKILHINSSGRFGGAAIAALRLHRALNSNGVQSAVLCFRDPSDEFGVSSSVSGLKKKENGAKNILVQKIAGFLGGGNLCSYNIFPSGLATYLNRSDADIIHLHWINAEIISIAELAKIKKPVVWTLHDMWPFCGAEHYTTDTQYTTGYQGLEARIRGLKPNVFFDLNRWTFLRKQKHWKNLHPHLVAPSNWLAECVRQSVLFKNFPIKTIPNCLDLKVFKPLNQAESRKRFGLPLDRKLILFGAYSPMDRRKGGKLLEEALKRVGNQNLDLVVFGAKEGMQIAGLRTYWLGSFSKETDLAQLYNAADLFAAPSQMDNLPNTVAEAIACGTPVAAFNIGGMPDMIQHQQNGWLAEAFDVVDFAKGIEWVLGGGGQRGGILTANARSRAEDLFSEQKVAVAYRAVYAHVLSGMES